MCISKGFDSLRKPRDIWFPRFHNGQFLIGEGQDPVWDVSSGHGRVVARKVHGDSSPGGRLDREGIG